MADDLNKKMDQSKKKGRADDSEFTSTVQLGGKKLEGEDLKRFQKLRANNPLMKGMYNEDGTPKE